MSNGSAAANDQFWLISAALILAATIFGYPLLLGVPLLDPDEGLHASIAQEMVERGDWVTPRLLGTPFLDKPILYFWAEAASLRLFGMHEAAVRLPGLLFGLLGAVTTGLVGLRMFGPLAGLLAGMFYASTILPAALAQAAAHDIALVPWVNLALLLFWQSDRASSRFSAVAYAAGIGVLLGLACLTKGLVGIAMVGVAYGTYLVLMRRLSLAACLRGAAALVLAGAVACTWYLAVEWRNPGYLHYYFVQRHLMGFATESQIHGDAPWWYYLPLLLGGGLPWISYLPAAVRDIFAKWRPTWRGGLSGARADGAEVLLWCWLIGCTAFLSISHSKLITYLWPVFPAVALLAAATWARFLEGTLGDQARRLVRATVWLSCLSGPLFLPIAMRVVEREYSLHFSAAVWTIGILTAIVSAAPLAFWLEGRPSRFLASAMCSLSIQFAFIMTAIVPPVSDVLSAHELAEHFNRQGEVPPRLWLCEDRIGSILFYLDPELRASLHEKQLQELDSGQSFQAERGAVVAIPERRLRRVGRYCDLKGLPYQSAGHYRLYNAADLQARLLLASSAKQQLR